MAIGCVCQVGEVGGSASEGGGTGEDRAGEGAGVGCEHGAGGGEFAVDLLQRHVRRIKAGKGGWQPYLEEFRVHEHALFQACI